MRITQPPVGLSADTEILTRNGWVRVGQLTYLHEIATRTADGRFEWQHPERVNVQRYDGLMVAFSNKSLDLLLAPGHPVLIRRPAAYMRMHPKAKGRDWHTRPASWFAAHPSAQFEVPATSRWEGTGPAEFVIPGWEANRVHPAHERAAEWLLEQLTDDWTPSAPLADAARAAGIGKHAFDEGRRLIGAPQRRCGSTRHGKGVSWWETGRPTREFVRGTGHYRPMREFRMPMEAFCAFLGLYLSEGHVRKDRNDVIISQFPTSRHLPEIRAILGATGLRWNYLEVNTGFVASHRTLAPWLRANTGGRAWEKRVPDGFKEYPVAALEALLRGLMIGDGHNGPVGQRYYTTTSEQLADVVQEIFQKVGRDAWVRPTSAEELNKYDYGLTGFKGKKRASFVVRERMQSTHWLPAARELDYCGSIHLVTVPGQMMYVRRKPRPTWCATG
jgi:hypothetical protein